ncbi:unnamed protein product, partial [Mycena citricolor]
MMRTYAIYGRPKKLLVLFAALWVGIASISLWAVFHWTSNFDAESDPVVSLSGTTSNCGVIGNNNLGLVAYASIAVTETVVGLLTIWHALRKSVFSRSGSAISYSKVMITFYRDGIMFYVMMLSIYFLDIGLQLSTVP